MPNEIVTDRRQIYPIYSKTRVDVACKSIKQARLDGAVVVEEDENIVENWRASHTHVLNTWQVILRQRIKDKNVIFAQRLKRKNTIYDKISARQNKMLLSRMHDIAGCRLIFKNEKELRDYVDNLHSSTSFKHVRKETQCKDYIENPKDSGYRGIHDVYAFKSKKGYDRSEKWNGLLVEIQYRTVYQHAWATAVEIGDYLNNCRAKFSEGNDKQQEFFKLASEIIARAFENRKSCRADLSNSELISNFKAIEEELHLLERLKQLKKISEYKSKFEKNIIIHFKLEKNIPTVEIENFDNLKHANVRYFEMEKEFPDDNIVLVKSNDKKNILEAYRNYFADTKNFTNYIDEGIKKLSL